MKEVILVLFFSLSSVVYANTYYVATDGKDSNPGTKALPWMTWQKAFDAAKAGDTVYFRGGTWYPTSHGVGNTVVQHSPRTVAGVYEGVTHGYNGTPDNPVCFFNYPGEVPILDCSRVDMAGHRFNTGLGFTLSQYVHTKGLTIRNVYQPISGELACGVGADACAHMIFSEMDVYNIGGRGMTYWGANGYFGINNDSVHYYNCDIHDCYDPLSQEPGNGADGWKGGNEPGGYFYFEGCRAWNCSDDGFDVSGNSYAKFDKCWSFGHGWKGIGLDGNGFKFGAISDSFPSPMRIITRCLAAFNHGSGYYDLEYANYYRNNSRVYNNTSFKNGYGFTNSTNAPKPWCLSVYKNNVSYKSTELTPDGRPYNAALLDATYPESNNTWKLNDPRPGSWPWFVEAITVTDADFISIDSTGISGPRKADGSLPDINFLKINSTSKLKDAGIDVGLPYYGSAPDLGYSEYTSGTITPSSPVYLSSVIQNSAPSKLEMTYSLTLSNILPATSAFVVQVNSVTRSVSSVVISGVKVTLTLGSPVKYGDVVTVAYNKPATNPLQTAAGGQAASYSAQNVTNNVASAASPVYVSSVVENATPSRLEITYSLSLANIVPATSAFTVMVNSSARSISSVTVSGAKVQLTLGSPVKYGDVVTVAYNKPATNPLQTAAGGQAASFSAQNVTNNVASAASPVYVSSVVENATPSRLEITYSLSLANIVPATSAFTVMVNSSARSISSVTVSGAKVQLTLGSPVKYGDVVTVAYNKPATNHLQTAAGGQAASFSAQNVTNNVASAASPVYVSSVVENATPSRLEITYSLSLANIVPATSAFTVMVNSSARSISSVTVSGAKVQLTLGSPVKYGDVVTVAYNKPATNPLQTAAGGQSASFTDKTVINNIGSTNTPPVIVVSYRSSSYSGFVNEINASGSYDSNKDNLTYTWIVPTGIAVSSTTGSIIKYLGPVVSSSQEMEFTLSVNDGKTTETRIIPIEILPYKPELEVAEVSNIEASSYQAAYYPYNIIDGNIGTMWSASGADQWLIVELKHPFTIQHIKLAFQPGQKMESYFDILGSKDKVVWEPILIKSASCSFSGDLQVFEFPPLKTGKEFSYIKLIGQGNMNDSWNYISELKIFGFRQRNSLVFEQLPVKIYPNPAKEIVTIRIDESTLMPDLLKLIDLSGVVCLEEQVDPDIREFKIPINLKNGIYILQLCSGRMTLFAQKLIVTK